MIHEATVEDAATIRTVAAQVIERGAALAQIDRSRIAVALAKACSLLVSDDTEIGRLARDSLPRSTGLSREMVDWALRTTLAGTTPELLLATADGAITAAGPSAREVPPRLAVTVLAGNVFTASFRGIALPLLLGAPVLAKASSRDDLFPRIFRGALAVADELVAGAFGVVTFQGGNGALEDALCAQADVLAVYGGDTTVATWRARISGTTRFVAHGHGLGVAYIPGHGVASDDEANAIAGLLALDVAAYDQRGCLSPHAIFIDSGGTVSARNFARRLAETGLARLARELPRGPLPTEAGAAQLQWRGVATIRGELFEGDGYGVSWEGDGSLRISPGYRNVAVHEVAGLEDLARRLAPLGAHLKVIGVAGDSAIRRHVAAALPRAVAPRVTSVGTMQTPPLDALADGLPPWEGLLSYVQFA